MRLGRAAPRWDGPAETDEYGPSGRVGRYSPAAAVTARRVSTCARCSR
jgi:hypothetical protein